jgi:hypothetical protein
MSVQLEELVPTGRILLGCPDKSQLQLKTCELIDHLFLLSQIDRTLASVATVRG